MSNSLSFEQLLQQSELPDPGPDYYEARRKLWLTPPQDPPANSQPSSTKAREKLEQALSHPNAAYDLEIWNNGLERVWRGLSSGGNLKTRLPLSLIIKIVHASWLRDRTWPAGMRAPSSGDEQPQASAHAVTASTSRAITAGTGHPEPASTTEERLPIPIIESSELVEPPSPLKIKYRHNRGR